MLKNELHHSMPKEKIVPKLFKHEQKYLTYYSINDHPSQYLPPPKTFNPSFTSMLYKPIKDCPADYVITQKMFDLNYGAEIIEYTSNKFESNMKNINQ